MKKIFLKILINTLLGFILVFVWSRFVNLSDLVSNLRLVNFAIVLPPFIIFFLISGLLRAWRLKLLLRRYKLGFMDILMLNFLSQFLSFVIPVRAGEVAKSVYFSAHLNMSFAKTIVWVFIDRFLDFLVVLLLICGLLIFVSTGLPKPLVNTILILMAVFVILFIAAIKSEILLNRVVNLFSRILILPIIRKKFLSFANTIIEGFEVLRRKPLDLSILIIITIAATISDSLLWLFAFISLGGNFPFAEMLLGNSLTALTFLIPSAPGYIGSAEAAGLGVFSGILKWDTGIVSTASVIYHALTLIIILVAGITSLYILKFDLGLVWKKIRGN